MGYILRMEWGEWQSVIQGVSGLGCMMVEMFGTVDRNGQDAKSEDETSEMPLSRYSVRATVVISKQTPHHGPAV